MFAVVGGWGGRQRRGPAGSCGGGVAGLWEHREDVRMRWWMHRRDLQGRSNRICQRVRGQRRGDGLAGWSCGAGGGTAGWGQAGGSVACEVPQDRPVCLGPGPLLPCFGGLPVSTACGWAGRGSG